MTTHSTLVKRIALYSELPSTLIMNSGFEEALSLIQILFGPSNVVEYVD